MKQNITAIVILTLILTGSFFSINYTKNISEKLLDTLDMCEIEVTRGNWKTALGHISLTSTLWNKYRPRLALFLMHRDLNEISDLIVRVNSLILINDKNGYITENKRLATLVENIGKGDILTFDNLF